MTKKCIVVSDLHLGIPGSNKSKFMEFLDQLGDDVERLILLGDIFDLWRRDPLSVSGHRHQYLGAGSALMCGNLVGLLLT